MKRVGKISNAKAKILADTTSLLDAVQRLTATPIKSVEAGVLLLNELRSASYEKLNVIQHEFMILRAAEWLLAQGRCSVGTLWSWHPQQTGSRDEPDLRGEYRGAIIVSAEITTSAEPKGVIDSRMAETLEKLSRMAGQKFYFTVSSVMCQRARTKVRKKGWEIEVVDLAT